MSKRLGEVDTVQKDLIAKHKIKQQQKQNEIDLREMEISRIKKIVEIQDTDANLLKTKLQIADDRV
jgi:hypothetical protein